MAAIPPVHFQDVIRVFEQDGFRFDRQEGDHRIYVKAGVRRVVGQLTHYREAPDRDPDVPGRSGVHHQKPPPDRRHEPGAVF